MTLLEVEARHELVEFGDVRRCLALRVEPLLSPNCKSDPMTAAALCNGSTTSGASRLYR